MALHVLAPAKEFAVLQVPVARLIAAAPPGTVNPYAFAAEALKKRITAPFPGTEGFKRTMVFYTMWYLVCALLCLASMFVRWQRGKFVLWRRVTRQNGTYFKPNASSIYLFPAFMFAVCIFISLVKYCMILFREEPASNLVPWRTLPWSAVALSGIWQGYTYLYSTMFCDDITSAFLPYHRPPVVPHISARVMNSLVLFSPIFIFGPPIILLVCTLHNRNVASAAIKEVVVGLATAAKQAAVAAQASGSTSPIVVDPAVIASLQVTSDKYFYFYRRILGSIRLLYGFYAIYSVITWVLFITIGIIISRELSMQINILLDLISREESIRLTYAPSFFSPRYLPHLWSRFKHAFDPSYKDALEKKRQRLPKDMKGAINHLQNSQFQFILLCLNHTPCAVVYTVTSIWGIWKPYLRPDQSKIDEIRTLISYGNWIVWGTGCLVTLLIYGMHGNPLPSRSFCAYRYKGKQFPNEIETAVGEATTQVGTMAETEVKFVGAKKIVWEDEAEKDGENDDDNLGSPNTPRGGDSPA